MNMPNPNAPLCECSFLERLSREPSCPIEFDAALNEYHIVSSNGGRTMIYHCPFCGGRSPESRRGDLFMHITNEEMLRLQKICAPMKMLADVLAAWGHPDYDFANGYGITEKDADGRPRTTSFRKLTFEKLSASANVDVVVYPDDRVGFSFTPKDNVSALG